MHTILTGINARLARWRDEIAVRRLTPARITGIYVAFGVVALYVSDVVLPAVVSSQPLLARLQFAKGFLEIGFTAALIYVLTARSWRSLRETNEHLAATRQGLSVLHRIFRHNLRNDITVVAGHADSLKDAVDHQPLTAHCNAIQDSCEDLIVCTEKAKLVADLNRAEVDTAEVELSSTLHSVRRRIESQSLDVDLDVSIPRDAAVLAHEYVEFAVMEVIENAILHHDGASPSVRVVARESPEYSGWLELSVEDDGPGIPPQELESLDRTEEPLTHSSGVGLWMASWIVYRSGGDFAIENTERGCRVTITLPTPATTSNHRAESALERFLA